MSFYSTHDRRHAACPEKARYSKCLRCNRVHYHNSNQEGQTVRNKREVFPNIPDENSATPIAEVNIANLKCGELITIKKVLTGTDFIRDRFSLVVDHHKGAFEFVSGEDLELLNNAREMRRLRQEVTRWSNEGNRAEGELRAAEDRVALCHNNVNAANEQHEQLSHKI